MPATSPKPLTFLNLKEEEAYYGVTGAALRKWKAKGLAAGDPFPVTDPAAVTEWYRRLFRKSVPQPLAAAAARFMEGQKKRPRRKPTKLAAMDPASLREALERCRRLASSYGKKLEEAISGGNAINEQLYREPYLKSVHQLGQIERAVVDVERRRKELIPRNEVVIAWEGVIGLLPRALEKALIGARPERVASDEWPGLVRAAMDKAFGLLNTTLPELLAGTSAAEPETESPGTAA